MIIVMMIITGWSDTGSLVTWPLPIAWNATCPDTFAVSHVLASSTCAGSEAATAEAIKSQKFADFTTGVDFIPFAIKTSGT